MVKADVQLDAKGLACPMPVVKTKLKMNEMKEGQVLEVQATDKGSIADLSAWAKTVGHQYLGIVEKDDVLYHYIRKCSDDTCDDITFEPTITHEELQKRDGLVLDVREEAEFAFGHIEGAKSIPFGELEKRLNELDKEQEIYVICRSGKRSTLAAQILNKNGFSRVFNVLPGMAEWKGKIVKEVK